MYKRGTGLVLVVLLSVAGSARADQEFDDLEQAYDQAQQGWFEQLQKSEEAERPPHPAKEFLPKFRAYAEKHAGKSEAIEALGWLVGAAGQVSEEAGKPAAASLWALERLTAAHADDPAIKTVLRGFRYAAYAVGGKPLVALYERIIEKNPDKEA